MPDPDYELAKQLHDAAKALHPIESTARRSAPEVHGFWFNLIEMLYEAERRVLDGRTR